MSMQMDACFKKEWIGTLFVWVGALEGVFGGGGGSLKGVHPKKYTCHPKKKSLLTQYTNFRTNLCSSMFCQVPHFALVLSSVPARQGCSG